MMRKFSDTAELIGHVKNPGIEDKIHPKEQTRMSSFREGLSKVSQQLCDELESRGHGELVQTTIEPIFSMIAEDPQDLKQAVSKIAQDMEALGFGKPQSKI